MTVFAVVALLNVIVVNGFFLNNDPCNVEPRYSGGIPRDPEFTTTINIPKDCRNGTFRWDYPKGHTMVHFLNTNHVEMKICFGDDLGGDIFTIVDLTDGANVTLPHVERDDIEPAICTPVSSSAEILLRIDAPPTMYYMGAVSYAVKS